MKRKRWPPKRYLTPEQAQRFMAELKRRKRIDFPALCQIGNCRRKSTTIVTGSVASSFGTGISVPSIECCERHVGYAKRKLRLQSQKRPA